MIVALYKTLDCEPFYYDMDELMKGKVPVLMQSDRRFDGTIRNISSRKYANVREMRAMREALAEAERVNLTVIKNAAQFDIIMEIFDSIYNQMLISDLGLENETIKEIEEYEYE